LIAPRPAAQSTQGCKSPSVFVYGINRGFYRFSAFFDVILIIGFWLSSIRILPAGRAMAIKTFREKCRYVILLKHLS
jgi:hypothetical protein